MRKQVMRPLIAVMSLVAFSSCQNVESQPIEASQAPGEEQKEMASTINYLEVGQNLALDTKSALGKNLIAVLGEKGAAGAVEFCNTRAIPITDSMSVHLNANIKRVSDKPRNPANKANTEELAYIKDWKTAQGEGGKLAPRITEKDGKVLGYYPIVANQMCLQCHGKPKVDIDVETLSVLDKLYPDDKAIGYADAELRGIFVVEMDK